jgi:hypothetical protein
MEEMAGIFYAFYQALRLEGFDERQAMTLTGQYLSEFIRAGIQQNSQEPTSKVLP